MNNSGFFLCGLLAGVVLSAACGFDFFPSDDGAVPDASVVSDDDLAGSDREETDPDATDDPTAELREKLASAESREAELDRLLAESRTEATSAKAEIEALRGAIAQAKQRETDLTTGSDALRTKLGEATDALALAETTRREREAELKTHRVETNNLLKEYFRTERSVNDATLVLKYFASSVPEDYKAELIDVLLEKNPHVLTAISPSHGEPSPAEGEPVPAASDADAGEPTPGVARP